jgi:hypothetical protein
LSEITVDLGREDDGVRRRDKGVFVDSFAYLSNADFGGQGEFVVDFGFGVAVVTVHCCVSLLHAVIHAQMRTKLTFDAATPSKQDPDIPLDRTLASPLFTDKIRVMRARDEILWKRSSHVDLPPRCVILGREKVGERVYGPFAVLSVRVEEPVRIHLLTFGQETFHAGSI